VKETQVQYYRKHEVGDSEGDRATVLQGNTR
jgi:hypothetical protein